MKRQIRKSLFLVSLLWLLLLLLTGCGGSSSTQETATFQVELINLTAGQPFSPVAVILHDQGYSVWQIGQPSGNGLEQLAEGGDQTLLVQEAAASADNRDVQSGTGIILPGSVATVNVSGLTAGAHLTVASMLVNTNDSFTGIDSADLAGLTTGASRSWDLAPFDAGTEGNSEDAATIPGPAGGGEGYNMMRDDRDYVAIHPGVVSADDGLVTSALNESHRFQNPVGRLVVTRIN